MKYITIDCSPCTMLKVFAHYLIAFDRKVAVFSQSRTCSAFSYGLRSTLAYLMIYLII
jgi:hypothetical protein